MLAHRCSQVRACETVCRLRATGESRPLSQNPLELELSSRLQGEALKMPFTHLPWEESGTDGATYRDMSQET